MGCDIHFHIEVKMQGIWQHYAAPYVSRDYELFYQLAGVRGHVEEDGEPISQPKGLPEDSTMITKQSHDIWRGDAHSVSWLDITEIEQLEDWLKTRQSNGMSHMMYDLEHGILKTYLFGNSFTSLKKYPQEESNGVQDVRFVFWFDN